MGKEYPQTKREYQQIVISRLKVICQRHWHAVDWKERCPCKVVCVHFEWCNIWGGSPPTVQIDSKVTSIDLDIASSEGVSGELYHSFSVSEAERYWNIWQQWYFCAHSTVQSFLGIKLNRQKPANVQCAKLRLSEGVSARHYGIDGQTVHWEHETLSASVDWLTDSIADIWDALAARFASAQQSYQPHCLAHQWLMYPLLSTNYESKYTGLKYPVYPPPPPNRFVLQPSQQLAQTVQQHSWWYSEYRGGNTL